MKKRLGLLTLSLVLALGSLGVAYAAWTDEVTVEGSVTTGSLCWRFPDCVFIDPHPPVNPGGDYPTLTPDYGANPGFAPDEQGRGFWLVDKNVGWGECELSADGKTLNVTLHNAYPCYFNSLSFYVMNCGTVPLKIDHVLINETKLTSVSYVPLDLSGDGVYDFEIRYGDNFGAQIEPGPSFLEFSLWMHVLQPAPQNDTLSFSITLVAVQWDEYPLP